MEIGRFSRVIGSPFSFFLFSKQSKNVERSINHGASYEPDNSKNEQL